MPSKATKYNLYTTDDDGATLYLRDVIEGYSKKEAVAGWVKTLPTQLEMDTDPADSEVEDAAEWTKVPATASTAEGWVSFTDPDGSVLPIASTEKNAEKNAADIAAQVAVLSYLAAIKKAVDDGDVAGIPAFVVAPQSSVFVQKPKIQTTVSVEFG